MVKGLTRRVVIVDAPDPTLFEQAIFVVRDYSVPRRDAVREACRIANGYLAGRTGRRRRMSLYWKLAIAFAAGVLAASAAWAVACLLM